MIGLLSAPNTGTHFTLDLLKMSPEIGPVIDYNRGFWGIFRKEITRHDLRYEDVPDDLSKVVYRRHILGKECHGDIDLLCIGLKVVIPFRDPLASLISRRNRNPGIPFYDHIDALEYIAVSPHVANSFVFPIDTEDFKSFWQHRRKLAKDMFLFCNLRPIEMTVWAKDNEKQNAMPEYYAKAAYDDGDVKAATKGCYGEYLYLKSKEDVIRPFMERMGYRSAIWWD